MLSKTFLPLSSKKMGDKHQPQRWKGKGQRERERENKLLYGIPLEDTYSQPQN